MATPQQLLEAVEQGILDASTAQYYTIRGRELQRARLADLMQARERLKQEIADGATNSGYMGELLTLEQPT